MNLPEICRYSQRGALPGRLPACQAVSWGYSRLRAGSAPAATGPWRQGRLYGGLPTHIYRHQSARKARK